MFLIPNDIFKSKKYKVFWKIALTIVNQVQHLHLNSTFHMIQTKWFKGICWNTKLFITSCSHTENESLKNAFKNVTADDEYFFIIGRIYYYHLKCIILKTKNFLNFCYIWEYTLYIEHFQKNQPYNVNISETIVFKRCGYLKA